MPDTSRRVVLAGAAGLVATVACLAAGAGAEASDEALTASLGTLVEELCRRGLQYDAIAALAPVLEHWGQMTIRKHVVQDAIQAIELLYKADEEDWTYKHMRDWAGHVSTRLKWETGQEKPPMRDGPGTDI